MCISSYDDGECAAAFTLETRTARKQHICCECGKPINKGEKYEYLRGVWDGVWETYKTCSICKEVRSHVYCKGIYTIEHMWEDIRDLYIPGMGVDCLEGLSVHARDVMIATADNLWSRQ